MRDLEFTKNEKLELIYDVVAGLMSVVAVLIVMMEFSNSFTAVEEYYIHIFDNIIYFIFLGDYFIRLILSKDKKKFLLSNIIDFIAILPFGFINSFKYGSMFKLMRVGTYLLRLIGNTKEVMFTNNFIYALGVTIIITILGSIGIYCFEGHKQGGINTYGDALWWSVVTVSTVGYGDIAVVTRFGRVVACMLMFTGIGFLSMLTSTMSTFFFKRHSENSAKNYLCNGEDLTLDISKLSEENRKNIINYYNYLCYKEKI